MKHLINEELSGLTTINRADPARIHYKLDELIEMLNDSDLSDENIREIQEKFERALKYSKPGKKAAVDQLLFIDKLDKRNQRKNSALQTINRIVKIIIGILLILLGFGMIIMPAPPYFEMFTLFYINPNDGITIMDVISLIVVFIGVAILINPFTKLARK